MPEAYKFPDEDEDTGTSVDKETAQDLEVEIVDDTPEADRGRAALNEEVLDPTDDEVAEYSSKVQDRIKKLTHARHDERREKEKLQRERDELERMTQGVIAERDELRKQYGKGVEVMTTQAKTMADTEVAAAKAKLKAAHEAFDTDAIVDAQEELNSAQMRKASVENMRFAPAQTQEKVVESHATTQKSGPTLHEKTAKWMSNNKWFGQDGDPALTGYALGLHQKMVAEHGDAYGTTDEYYSRIDTAMRRAFPDKFSAGTKKPTNVVASATRVLAPRKVQLTSTQVALAKKLGMTPQQYAAEVVKLEE